METENVYYDKSCCQEQESIADNNFHCLQDVVQLDNYTALQEDLHESLDNLNTCVEGTPASPASSSLHATALVCSNAGEYLGRDITSINSGGVDLSISVERCFNLALAAFQNGGYCDKSFKAQLDIASAADCVDAGGLWHAGSIDNLFSVLGPPNFENNCRLCFPSATLIDAGGNGGDTYTFSAGSSGAPPACSTNETFLALLEEVATIEAGVQDLATQAVETLQPSSIKLTELSNGKMNDFTVENGTFTLHSIAVEMLQISDFTTSGLTVGYLEVSNIHGPVNFQSHSLSNFNLEKLQIAGTEIDVSASQLNILDNTSTTLDGADFQLLHNGNGTVQAQKVIIMGTDSLTLQNVTVEGTLHLPDIGVLSSTINTVLKSVSQVSADDIMALAHAVRDMNGTVSVDTLKADTLSLSSKYLETLSKAYGGTTCESNSNCQILCNADDTCLGYSNLLTCSDANRTTEAECFSSCDVGSTLLKDECGECSDLDYTSKTTCVSSCDDATKIQQSTCVNEWYIDDTVTDYTTMTQRAIQICAQSTDVERVTCCENFAVGLNAENDWSFFVYNVASGSNFCTVFTPDDNVTLIRTGDSKGTYSSYTARKWTTRSWTNYAYTTRTFDITTTFEYGPEMNRTDVAESRTKLDAAKLVLGDVEVLASAFDLNKMTANVSQSDLEKLAGLVTVDAGSYDVLKNLSATAEDLNVLRLVPTKFKTSNYSYTGTSCADEETCQVACLENTDCQGYSIHLAEDSTDGDEFLVNTHTANSQEKPSVAFLSDGFVVVWQSHGQDGDNYGIYAQMYNLDGTTNGNEFQVNTYNTSDQFGPAVASTSDGFVIVWISNLQDGEQYGIFAQMYNADGTTNGNEFQVNTYTTSVQIYPAVSSTLDGFVVVWQSNGQDGSSWGIFAQMYNVDGTTKGNEFQVNTYTTLYQEEPAVASTSDGFIVVWSSNGQDGDGNGIFAQMYNLDGTTNGNEFQVNTYTTSSQGDPAVASTADGFVVVWSSYLQDGDNNGVYAQMFHADGTKYGNEFQVNTYTTSSQEYCKIASTSDGFVIVWVSNGQDGDNYGIFAQLYNTDGTKNGNEFQVNTYSTNHQEFSAVASTSDGFVIVWQSEGQDGNSTGIYAQRFAAGSLLSYTYGVIDVNSTELVSSYAKDVFVRKVVLLSSPSTLSLEGASMATLDVSFLELNGLRMDASASDVDLMQHTNQSNLLKLSDVLTTGTEANKVQSSIRFVASAQHYGSHPCANASACQVVCVEDAACEGYTEVSECSDASIATEAECVMNHTWSITFAYGVELSTNCTGCSSFGKSFPLTSSMEDLNLLQRFPYYAVTSEHTYGPAACANASACEVACSGDEDCEGYSYVLHEQTKNGDEFQVNTYTTSTQREPKIASTSDGFVVVSESFGQDGSGYSVYAQMYNLDGTTNGNEFQVNTYTTSSQSKSAVASTADGFVVVWNSLQDGGGYGIYAQMYNADGSKKGSEFKVNTNTTYDQTYPAVASTSDGFVVVWQSNGQDGNNWGIFAQMYNVDGTTNGNEFQVNTYTTNSQMYPAVVSTSDGFIIVWQSLEQDGNNWGIFAQMYNVDGTTNGNEFQVNTHTTSDQMFPAVTSTSDGFVIVWSSNGQDGDGNGIFAQMYNLDGTKNGNESQVNTYTNSSQSNPAVASTSSGFVIVWQSYGQDGNSYGIFAQMYNLDGTTKENEFQVNNYTTHSQQYPAVTSTSDGFVMVWQSDGQDGDSYGIYAQRFQSSKLSYTYGVIDVNGTSGGMQKLFRREVLVADANDLVTITDGDFRQANLDTSEIQLGSVLLTASVLELHSVDGIKNVNVVELNSLSNTTVSASQMAILNDLHRNLTSDDVNMLSTNVLETTKTYTYEATTNSYAGATCVDKADCKLKCTADGDCEGYSEEAVHPYTCSNGSLATEAECLYEEVFSGVPDASLALTEAECGAYANSLSLTYYDHGNDINRPKGCWRYSYIALFGQPNQYIAQAIWFNSHENATAECGLVIANELASPCIQKTSNTWNPSYTYTYGVVNGTSGGFAKDVSGEETLTVGNLTATTFDAQRLTFNKIPDTYTPTNDTYSGTDCEDETACQLACSKDTDCQGYSLGAPVSFSNQTITTQASGAVSVYAADLDGDGDMDVLSASWKDDKIGWYENTDGQGTFSTLKTITTQVNGAQSVYAADLDGDGDMDVLSASYSDDKIAWYENMDGQGTFSTQKTITTQAIWAFSVYAADIDGDGDIDVLSASYTDDKIAWYENTDGQGTFSTQKTITTQADGAKFVYAADIDGDGDMDVLSASQNDDKIAWYENTDGQGTFSTQNTITTQADSAKSVYAADLDGDGDMDVLSASWNDNKIAWYENTDGQGTFSTQKTITTQADGAQSVYAADLDADGDMDVLSASYSDDKIAWYENIDGQGTFSTQKIITQADGAQSVYAADLDGDGSLDVLSASVSDDKIAWYENNFVPPAYGVIDVSGTGGGMQKHVGESLLASAATLNLLHNVTNLTKADFEKLAAIDTSANTLTAFTTTTATTEDLNQVDQTLLLDADANVVLQTNAIVEESVTAFGTSFINENMPSDISMDNVESFYTNSNGYAVLYKDGTVDVWGHSDYGGCNNEADSAVHGDTCKPSNLQNVVDIKANGRAFAAISSDKSVKIWGSNFMGNSVGAFSNVEKVFHNSYAFAMVHTDGTVTVYGSVSGGGCNSGTGSSDFTCKPATLANVVTITANSMTFAALSSDGSVTVWGSTYRGGCSSGTLTWNGNVVTNCLPSGLKGTNCQYNSDGVYLSGTNCVKKIVAEQVDSHAFAVLKSDGSVTAWGSIENEYPGYDPGITNVKDIIPGTRAFAALKNDNSVEVWGSNQYGGCNTGTAGSNYECKPNDLNDVRKIATTNYAFLALEGDGNVRVWGGFNYGGCSSGDGGGTSNQNYYTCKPSNLKGTNCQYTADGEYISGTGCVKEIFAKSVFHVLKDDNTIESWGEKKMGACVNEDDTTLYTCRDHPLTDIVQFVPGTNAAVARHSDGSITSWGSKDYGGIAPTVVGKVTDIINMHMGFVLVSEEIIRSMANVTATTIQAGRLQVNNADALESVSDLNVLATVFADYTGNVSTLNNLIGLEATTSELAVLTNISSDVDLDMAMQLLSADASGNLEALDVNVTGTIDLTGYCSDATKATKAACGTCSVESIVTDTECTYPATNSSYAGATCANAAACQLACTLDDDCEGYSVYDELVKDGDEFLVNTYTTSSQKYPAVASTSSGFVVVWSSSGQDGGGDGIFAQMYNADGMKNGNEFQVNNYTTSHQTYPAVTSTSDGFVVVWHSYGQDGNNYGIFAQMYNLDATKNGNEFQVNTYTTNSQSSPAVASTSDGFVIVWHSYGQVDSNGIFAQMYNLDGTTNGNEFQVNTYTTSDQQDPEIASTADGFVVVWGSNGQDGGSWGIFAQMYNADGTKNGNEFQVNNYTGSSQGNPAVASTSSGFVIVWSSDGQDGSNDGIFAQMYNFDGTTKGNEFQVNNYTTSYQNSPSVTSTSDGFIITWESVGQDGDHYGVFAQMYNLDGTTNGNEFQVNNYTTSNQHYSAVASTSDGFVVVWHSNGQDGDTWGIYAQRFQTSSYTYGVIDVSSTSGGFAKATWTPDAWEVDVLSVNGTKVTASVNQLNQYAQLTDPKKLDAVITAALTKENFYNTSSTAIQLNLASTDLAAAATKINEVRCSDDAGDILQVSCSVDSTSGTFDGTASDCAGDITASYVNSCTGGARTYCVAGCSDASQTTEAACVNSCSDVSKTTEAECVDSCSNTSLTTEVTCLYTLISDGTTSLASDHANYVNATECQAYADATAGLSWQISSYFGTGKPMGCFMAGGYQIQYNTATSSTQDCDTSYPCVQKSGNTWTLRTWTAREWGTAYGNHAIGDINAQGCSDGSDLTQSDCLSPVYSYSSSVKIFNGTTCADDADCQNKCNQSATCDGYTTTCDEGDPQDCGFCNDATISDSTSCVNNYCSDGSGETENTCGACNDSEQTTATACVDQYCVEDTSKTTENTCGTCSDNSILDSSACIAYCVEDESKTSEDTCGTCSNNTKESATACADYCSDNTKTTEETCGACNDAEQVNTTTCINHYCVQDTSKTTESTCGSCNDDTQTDSTNCVNSYCVEDTDKTTESTCGSCSDTDKDSSTTCVDSCYDYSSSTKVFNGSSCLDTTDCEQKCTEDNDCAGYTSACSISTQTTEDTCGTCSSTGTNSETCGTCDDASKTVQSECTGSFCSSDTSKTTEDTCGTCNATYGDTAASCGECSDPAMTTPETCVSSCSIEGRTELTCGTCVNGVPGYMMTEATCNPYCDSNQYSSEETCEGANHTWIVPVWEPATWTERTWTSGTFTAGTWETRDWTSDWTAGTWNSDLGYIFAYGSEVASTGGTSQERSLAGSCDGVAASRIKNRTWTADTWQARTWTADTWQARTWTSQWNDLTWTADTWQTRTWTADTWANRSWTTSWTPREWTESAISHSYGEEIASTGGHSYQRDNVNLKTWIDVGNAIGVAVKQKTCSVDALGGGAFDGTSAGCPGNVTESVSNTHFSSSTVYSYLEPVACVGSKTCEDGTKRAVACTACSDPSKTTEATCLYEQVDSGAPLSDTDANYVNEEECSTLPNYMGISPTSLTTNPSGCFQVSSGNVYFSTVTTTVTCATYDCIQKTGNTWTAGKTNVEVQLATYDMSKLNELQNLDRTVGNLTVDTLHGLGPELYANPLAKAGSATGTQTIVSCDFPGQVVDVADGPATYVCTSPTTWTPIAGESSIALKGANPDTIVQDSSYTDSGGVCYDGNGTKVVVYCSDSSKTTEADCLAHVEVTSGDPLASTHANYVNETECSDLATLVSGEGVQFTAATWSVLPNGCQRLKQVSTGNYVDVWHYNRKPDSTNIDCGTDVTGYLRICVQKSGNTWTQGITVSGQVDTTAACGTEVTLTYDCPGAAQVSRKVVVECP
jgi:hypothetical protein